MENTTLTPELKKAAEQTFKDHPKAKAIFVCQDGATFLEDAKSFALDHGRKRGGKVYEVTRESLNETPAGDSSDESGETEVAKMTVKEVAEWAAQQEDVEALKAALEAVQTKGGKDAIETRIAALYNGSGSSEE